MDLTSLICTNTVRDILISNGLLNVIRVLLRDKLDNSVIEEDDEEYCTHHHLYMTFQYTIHHSMESELRMHVNDINTYDVVDEIKSNKSQIRVMENEYLDVVSFNHGGRNNLLRKSHGKVNRYMNT